MQCGAASRWRAIHRARGTIWRYRTGAAALAAAIVQSLLLATAAAAPAPSPLGPYNMRFDAGGISMDQPVPATMTRRLRTGYSLHGWLNVAANRAGAAVVAELCDRAGGCTSVVVDGGRVRLGTSPAGTGAALRPGQWQPVVLSCMRAHATLLVDGRTVPASGPAVCTVTATRFSLAAAPTGDTPVHFGGGVAGMEVRPGAATPGQLAAWSMPLQKPALIVFTHVGAGWPVQSRAWIGLQTPQDAWTLPHAHAAPDAPVATQAATVEPLAALPDSVWALQSWRLATGLTVRAAPAALATAGYDDTRWWQAVVPGTVLTTLIARGVYPDPDHGLNNLAIPESLGRQDYWYRTQFVAPAAWKGRSLLLTFKGINYAAEIWLNGRAIGTVRGAFMRGMFDIADGIHPGAVNALAVHILPPPHPGIPSEESLRYGPGENGGSLALDGPTFIATEGWDWIPGIRDRDMGLWQGVTIHATGPVRLGDAQIVSHLDLPLTDAAGISIAVPVVNTASVAMDAVLTAHFADVTVRRAVHLPAGKSVVRFTLADFPQLLVAHPRLWWPNGYGDPALYDCALTASVAGAVSDTTHTRFGIREITYELSLFDSRGELRRVELDPARAPGTQLLDERHEALRQTPAGWAASLLPATENSPFVRPVRVPHGSLPFLTIVVNGVPIAARGGSWGMDDDLKRVSRERLEPYFRLHRLANLNIIRNWLGQDTEDVFYDLADEYGMLVLNDFWESTQQFQLEAEDPQLFLANATDVISRYRNHPSIALWFGRNEGVPQPILNEGLEARVRGLDGTRLYFGSSNMINLASSGPYNYRQPEDYFTDLGKGFAVEIGTPSLSTLESLEATIPAADRWPISDTLAYHDWHQGGNGDVASFMKDMTRRFGAPASLADFERKAQMLNYVSYRAIFEGFLAHLWTQNSGRMLWMTHPAWPSNSWQIYSKDMDTQASYYGVKTALEPLHPQMNLPDYRLAVVNTTQAGRTGLHLQAIIEDLGGNRLATVTDRLDAPANSTTLRARLPLGRLLQAHAVVIVELTLTGNDGAAIARNVYWQSRTPAAMRALDELPAQKVLAHAVSSGNRGGQTITVQLSNTGGAPALQAKLTVFDGKGNRILPAYYSDNCVSLLPHEASVVTIAWPSGNAAAFLTLRGWNVRAAKVPVEQVLQGGK